MKNAPTGTTGEAMSKDHTVTMEEAATLDFEPWSRADQREDLFTPPSNQEWNELGRAELPYVRLAFATMFRTKPELVAMFESEPDLMVRLMEDWKSSAETFENLGRVQALLDGAYARMLIAASIVAMQEKAL